MAEFITTYFFCGFIVFMILVLTDVLSKDKDDWSLGDMVNMATLWPAVLWILFQVIINNKKDDK